MRRTVDRLLRAVFGRWSALEISGSPPQQDRSLPSGRDRIARSDPLHHASSRVRRCDEGTYHRLGDERLKFPFCGLFIGDLL